MRIQKPASKEEADAGGNFTPLRPGEYDYEVKEASEEQSAAGNDMIKLTVWVYDTDGNRRTVFDYLLGTEKSQFKVRHFAESCGLVKEYERGELDAMDCEGKTGRLKLRIKPAQGDYPAGNQVQDYIASEDKPTRVARPSSQSRPTPTPKTNNDLNDDIPF